MMRDIDNGMMSKIDNIFLQLAGDRLNFLLLVKAQQCFLPSGPLRVTFRDQSLF
jgi:hypothetical protein